MELIGTAIETASGASILADDYPFATIHLATFCERGSRRIELLFGWVELLPHGFPQPRSTAPDCKSFRTSVAGLVCHSRTAMTGPQALDWYGEAARGRMTTPAALDGVAVKSAGIAVATDFAGQMTWPDTGIFIGSGIGEALVYELPFLPDWIHQPRINRTTPTPSPRLQGIVTHPMAAAWLGERIWLDFGLHPEWLGAVTLIAPNPLWSEMHHRKLPPEDAGPQSLLRFVPRPGADLTGLRITTYEQKLGAIGDVRAGRLGDASAMILPHGDPTGAIGLIVHDEKRGLLRVDPPTGFLDSISMTYSVASSSRELSAPTSRSSNATDESFRVTEYSDHENELGERDAVSDSAILAAAQRGRRKAGEALGQRWFGDNAPAAASFVRSLVGDARRRVQIYDPYVTGLELFRFLQAVSRRTVAVRAVTSRLPFKVREATARSELIAEFEREAKRLVDYRKGSSEVEIAVLGGDPPPLHDRFLVVDDDVWFTGNSLGTLGDRAGMMIRLPDPAPVVANLELLFAGAEDLRSFLARSSENMDLEGRSG
jgi:hypothetical protein